MAPITPFHCSLCPSYLAQSNIDVHKSLVLSGQSAICSQIWQCPVASVSVTYHWTTAPGDVAMINVFNTTGAQEGECGVIFFVDSTDEIIGGDCQGGSIRAWMPTSVMQSILTTLQSPHYYSYLTWYSPL